MLRVGPGATLSHETAAEIHGLIDKPIGPIHISVPAERHPGRRRKIRGVVIHRSRCLVAEWQPPWQLPRTTVEDTVLDLVAAARTFDDAYGWISRAVGRRLASPQSLRKALTQRSRMRWRAWLTAALEDAADGVHSPLERNYVYGVERAHGLPTARRQAKRRHGSGTRYLDNMYEDYSLCVELDGFAAHPAEGRWRDTHRDNANRLQGVETLRYGWPDTTENRCRTAAEIAGHGRRAGRGDRAGGGEGGRMKAGTGQERAAWRLAARLERPATSVTGGGAGAVLAAATRASKIRASSPSSGCHCTPTPNLCPCSSTASTTWSGVQATVRSPLPIRSMAW